MLVSSPTTGIVETDRDIAAPSGGVGSTRGLELLRIICFCIGDAVFGKYVRLSDVLPSETKMDLDLLELEIKERFLYEDLRPYTFPKY